MSKKTELAERKAGAVVPAEGYGEHAGAGFEGQTREDVSIPMLYCLQAQSPQVTDGVEGAKAGRILNNVTNDNWDEVLVVPVSTQHVYQAWRPREAGGGIVGTFAADDPQVTEWKSNGEFGKWQTPDGDDLVETFYVYAVRCDKEGRPVEDVVIPFSSTKIRVYKNWMYTARSQMIDVGEKRQNVPLFGVMYRLATSKQRNRHGEFFNFNFAFAGGDVGSSLIAPSDPRFKAALAMRDAVQRGGTRVVTDNVDEGGAGEDKPPF